jgi:hypothetical protein
MNLSKPCCLWSSGPIHVTAHCGSPLVNLLLKIPTNRGSSESEERITSTSLSTPLILKVMQLLLPPVMNLSLEGVHLEIFQGTIFEKKRCLLGLMMY